MALKGNQKKLDKNNNNRIDAQDFKILKAEKAKGRGQGLQDEKMKPGKVKPVKAVLGIAAMGLMGAKYLKKKNKTMSATPGIGASALIAKKQKEMLGKRVGGVMKAKRGKLTFDEKFKMQEKGLTDKKTGKLNPSHERALKDLKTSELKKMTKTGRNPRLGPGKGFPESKLEARSFLERRKQLGGGALKAAKATRLGKIALGVAGAGLAAKTYLNKKLKESKEKNKKMGGGMMKKYNKGGMSAGDKFNAKIKGMLDSYDDKKTPMKKDRIKQKLKASGKMGGGMMQRPMSYMGGGMMKPMGYKAGKSVKAKCKLGRNKPTKMY